MRLRVILTVAFLLIGPLSVGIVYADSDWYYCADGGDR
jgi:hypothetical protein